MNQAAVLPPLLGARPGRFASLHRGDRTFFLCIVALIWLGILMGFVPQIHRRLVDGATPYPLIVHFHAVIFVGWLVLLTTQVLLIRARRPDLHRRLGIFGAVLAAIMIVIGPATALVMHAVTFGHTLKSSPAFLAVQFTDILGFAGLAGAALAWRARPAAHKRLMLLATLYISDAGFSRWLNAPIGALAGTGFWGQVAAQYLPSDLVVLAIGTYDVITRGRPQAAYVGGVVWTAALQLIAMRLVFSAWWPPIANHLVGH